ncbi:MAG: PAS domain S-box protein [Verrucomicrobiales bacterium]|nr:PAS domain S-box protein [Verrucomicrobiales bacterium]
MVPISRANGCWSRHGWWGTGWEFLWVTLLALAAGAAEESVIRTVRDVQGLAPAQAAKQIPVEIHGVVTYYERKWDALFVQDVTGGSYIYPGAATRPDLKAGQTVTVFGRTRAGGGPRAASAIQEDRIAITEGRSAPAPEPLHLSYSDLAAGRADGQWIEVEGVVRVLWAERERFEIDLAMDGGRVRMHLPRPLGVPLPRALLHSRVRARGACGLALGDRGAVQGVRVFTPAVDAVELLEPATELERLPTRTFTDLMTLNPSLVSPPRTRVEGTVTCLVPEGPLFIESANGGLEVAMVEPRMVLDSSGETLPDPAPHEFEPGDWVAVVGYPSLRDGRLILDEAEVAATGKRSLPQPWVPSPADWAGVAPDARLVRIQGEVLHRLRSRPGEREGERYVVQSGDVTFDVQWVGAGSPALEPETVVRLTGVASAELNELGRVKGWRLWLRTLSDIETLGSPWFSLGRSARRLVLLGAGVVLALAGWALFLWRQLSQKQLETVELEARIASRTNELEQTNHNLRREVAERSRVGLLQDAIYRISEATHSVGDLPELYRQLHEIIGTLMPARNFYIALYDRVADRLIFPYYADEKSGAPEPRPWSHGLSEYVIRRREPLLADQSSLSDLARRGEVRQLGFAAQVWLGVPLIVNGRATGVMAVQDYSDSRALNTEHQRILTYVAGQTATAIERKRAEAALRLSQEALRSSQQRFRSAFASSPAVMTLARLKDGVLFEVNDAFLMTTGYAREDVIGRSTMDLGIWVREEERDELIRDVGRQGAVRGREMAVKLRDGRIRTMLLAAELVEIDGEPSILAASLDVTDRKEVEVQLRRALARERELGELKSNFVSLVSHEFRTPLEVILSSAEILERYHERLAPEQRGKQLRAIQKSVRRMADMMNEVLLLGRFEAGRVEFSPSGIDLAGFLGRIRDEIRAAMGSEVPIEVAIDIEDTDGSVVARGDEGLLGHIFTNLLSNAVKYSTPGSPVWFRVRRDGADAVFEVIDRGCGIPENDQRRLFQSFHRGSNVGNRSGTGLGLVIVKRCVDRHGGTVELASREGEGTTFTVRLPLFASLEAATAEAGVGSVRWTESAEEISKR